MISPVGLHDTPTGGPSGINEKEERAQRIITKLRSAVPSLEEPPEALNELRGTLTRLSRSVNEQKPDQQPLRSAIDSVDDLATGVYLALIVLSGQEEVSTPAFYNPEILLTVNGIREGLSSLQARL